MTENFHVNHPLQSPSRSPAATFAIAASEASSTLPAVDVSIVVPMFNEADGVVDLVREIDNAMTGVAHEIIVVDDCSTDTTQARLMQLKGSLPRLRVIAHQANAGQSRAIRSGVLAARGALIATLDGDGQNDPADLPFLIQRINNAGAPTVRMAAGVRTRRRDSARKRIASRVANAIRSRLLKDGAADTGCGLKVFDRSAYLRLPYFDHQHRYLPALMRREGFDVVFLPVSHRPRLHGRSKYTNLGRLAVAFRDLLGVMWLIDRSKSPMTISEL